MRVLPLLAALVGCTASPGPVPWTGAQPRLADALPRVRGQAWSRAILHLHSPWSHDACDGDPLPGGQVNEPCLQDLREGLCTAGVDAAFLTDHPDHAAFQAYDQLTHPRPGDVARPGGSEVGCPTARSSPGCRACKASSCRSASMTTWGARPSSAAPSTTPTTPWAPCARWVPRSFLEQCQEEQVRRRAVVARGLRQLSGRGRTRVPGARGPGTQAPSAVHGRRTRRLDGQLPVGVLERDPRSVVSRARRAGRSGPGFDRPPWRSTGPGRRAGAWRPDRRRSGRCSPPPSMP